jgi:hypothetical protein
MDFELIGKIRGNEEGAKWMDPSSLWIDGGGRNLCEEGKCG